MRLRHGDLHLILLVLLARRPMHGYELMQELGRTLGRRYRPSPGSIYPALASLEAEGLIEGREDGDRRTYELTGEGALAYTRRADRIERLESRLGVRIGFGIDVILARFARRVYEAARQLDESVVEDVLERAASRLESMTEGE